MRAMIIEQNTNYAYKLKYMDSPTFDKVRGLAVKFYRELPQELQDELYEALNRGVDVLDSEPQMTAYMFSFGKMHQAKLNYAFGKLPDDFLSKDEINIIDYGCGQALGTMCYSDFLREKGYSQKVKTITLIEPSEICMKRAALHVSVFSPDAEIKIVNKAFDDLTKYDIVCDEETPTLHILSNVLDITSFNLESFTKLIKDKLLGLNQFVCVGPYFMDVKRDGRVDTFSNSFQKTISFEEELEGNELEFDKDWTCKISVFTVIGSSVVAEKKNTLEVPEQDEKNVFVDEYGARYSKDGLRLLSCRRTDLERYRVKEGTLVIGYQAFDWQGDYSLKDISNMYSDWHIIGGINPRFEMPCSCLKQIILPNTITTIESEAFNNCEALEQINIPNSVMEIGDYAFNLCRSLEQIIIPNSVTKIGDHAFDGCHSLKEITIPDSVISIGCGVFSDCNSLTKITNLSSYYSVIDDMLIANDGNILIAYFGARGFVVIPEFISVIGEDVFSDAHLDKVILPNTLLIIEQGAFYSCTLQKITIPDSVEKIGEEAFSGSELRHITFNSSFIVLENNVFEDCESLEQIHIPLGSAETFKKMLDEDFWDKLVEQ